MPHIHLIFPNNITSKMENYFDARTVAYVIVAIIKIIKVL